MDNPLEPRVTRLEDALGDIRVMLGRIDERTMAMAATMATTMATREQVADVQRVLEGRIGGVREEVAEIRGRVANIPTVWQTIAIMVSLIGAMAAIAYGALHFAGKG